MLLKVIQRLVSAVGKNTRRTKAIILLVAPIFLLLRLQKYHMYSGESLIEDLKFEDADIYDTPVDYEDRPPHETIYILFTGSAELETRLNDRIRRLMVRSKSIQISREDTPESVFVKINLVESSHQGLRLHPLRSFQPNSDLITIAMRLFPPVVRFDLLDIFHYRFENRIDLELPPSEKSICDLCRLLRYYSNIHSHYYGIYYYIPLSTGIITLDMLKGFIICCIAHEAFEISAKFNPVVFLAHSVLYYFFPPVGFFILRKPHRAVYLFSFCLLNFRFGFLSCVYLYINEVWRMLVLDRCAQRS